MLGLDTRAFTINLHRRIRHVEHDELNGARLDDAHLALAGALKLGQDFVFHLHVPGIIIFAGLQHRARGRHRVAAALDFHRVEMRPVGDMVVGIELGADDIARLEIDEQIRTGAHRFQVGRRLA